MPLNGFLQSLLQETRAISKIGIRGIRLDDAMEMTLAALDHALVGQAKYLKVIHGQGTGALKTGIRKLCRFLSLYPKFSRW